MEPTPALEGRSPAIGQLDFKLLTSNSVKRITLFEATWLEFVTATQEESPSASAVNPWYQQTILRAYYNSLK